MKIEINQYYYYNTNKHFPSGEIVTFYIKSIGVYAEQNIIRIIVIDSPKYDPMQQRNEIALSPDFITKYCTLVKDMDEINQLNKRRLLIKV